MSAEDGPEQSLSETNCSDSKSPSDRQCLSQKDMFEDEVKEERNGGKNRQPTHNTQFIPPVAVSEKIIICIDTSQDLALGYTCTLSNKNASETSTIMNEALRVFFTNKLTIAKDTKFALVSIKPGDCELISNYTSDISLLVKSLSEMSGTSGEVMSDYDVTPIFSRVFSSIEFPENLNTKVAPDFLVRVIFIYNNSYSVPRVNEVDRFFAKFLTSPYCIFDIVFLHEAQSDFNSVVKIYEELSKIISPRSYLLECSRNVTLVFNTFAKLLAHPYQRVCQGLWEF